MSKIISIVRILVLIAIGAIGFYFFFGQELDEKLGYWYLHVFADKAIAVVAFLLFVRLYKKWTTTDPWLIAYERYFNKSEQ